MCRLSWNLEPQPPGTLRVLSRPVMGLLYFLPEFKLFLIFLHEYNTDYRYCPRHLTYHWYIRDMTWCPQDVLWTCDTCATCPPMQCFYCRLIAPHPNTYTFTKQLAECLVSSHCPDIPVVIARPSIGTSVVNVQPEPQTRALCQDLYWPLLERPQYSVTDFFYVLLTVHLSIFILVINRLDAQNFVLQ